MACCTVTLESGRTWFATAPAVPARRAGPPPPGPPAGRVTGVAAAGRDDDALGAGVVDLGMLGMTAGVSAAGAAAGAGEGAGLVGADAIGAAIGAAFSPLNIGGSNNTVYSRNKRPLGHCNCTMKSRKGARTGCDEVTLTTVAPFCWTTLNLRSPSTAGHSIPAWLIASCGARRTTAPCSSAGRSLIKKKTTKRGSLREEWSWISPKPSAKALPEAMATATAKTSLRI